MGLDRQCCFNTICRKTRSAMHQDFLLFSHPCFQTDPVAALLTVHVRDRSTSSGGESPFLRNITSWSRCVVVVVGRGGEVSVEPSGEGRTAGERPGRWEEVDPGGGEGHDVG